MDTTKLDFDDFIDTYKPITNHIDPHAGMDGKMFETFGKELEFVQSADSRCVWTILDCDGEMIIASGFHFVNRFAYLITEVQCPSNTSIEVNYD